MISPSPSSPLSCVQDSSFKFKHWLSPSTKLTISQLVPNSKWFLVPNPSFKIVHKGIAGKHSIVEATWDTLSRSGCAGCTVYAGDDKEYKADISVYSKKGAVLKARAKLRRGLVHSVSATVGAIGPILSLKSRFGDADKVDTSYNMAARVVSVHAKHMGGDQGSAPRPQVLLNVALPLGTATLQPQVILGMKWHF